MAGTIVNLWRQGSSRIFCKSDILTSNWSNFNNSTVGCASILFSQHQGIFTSQKREMSRVKTRHTHPRFVWPKKRRERHDQGLTADNQDFVNNVILDKYGPVERLESGNPYISPLKNLTQERGEWAPRSIRTGVIAKKIGIYPMWDKKGKKYLTTLLQVADNHVIKYIPPEVTRKNYGNVYKEGQGLLLVGTESCDPQMFTKEYCGLFNESGTLPKNRIHRFVITANAALQPGTPLYATHFEVGRYVDIYGKTIKHGFQGVMKRWGFHGMPATHGVTKSHRRGGNVGGGGEKGRIWPGTKQPGHMGGDRRHHKAVQILRINTKHNILYVKGNGIPGGTGDYVTVMDTFIKSRLSDKPPAFPTFYPDEVNEPIPDDIWADHMHKYADPTILFEEKL